MDVAYINVLFISMSQTSHFSCCKVKWQQFKDVVENIRCILWAI